MIRSAASSGAVPRPARGAAGRRALQGVLLAGGLIALGFLLGGQAHAADGSAGPVRSTRATPSRTVSEVRTSMDHLLKPADAAESAARAGRVASPSRQMAKPAPPADHVGRVVERVRPVTRAVERAVPVVRSVRPVRELVRPVVGAVVRPLADPPALPDLPGVPATHGEDQRTPPRAGAPQPGSAAEVEPGPGDQGPAALLGPVRTAGAPLPGLTDARTPARTDAPTAYGPDRRGARSGYKRARSGPEDGGLPQAPARRTPPGGASGATGSQPALDNAAPGHAQVHAVTPDHHAPRRLARGAPAAMTAAGTRDRYQDIPVFPG